MNTMEQKTYITHRTYTRKDGSQNTIEIRNTYNRRSVPKGRYQPSEELIIKVREYRRLKVPLRVMREELNITLYKLNRILAIIHTAKGVF